MSTEFHTDVTAILTPVCAAYRRQLFVRLAVRGLAAGAGVALAAGVLRLTTEHWVFAVIAVLAAIAFPAIYVFRALKSPQDWRLAARLVDDHFGLQDHTITALESPLRKQSPADELQLQQAKGKLASLNVKEAVPADPVHGMWRSIAVLALGLILAFIPLQIFTPNPIPGPHTSKAETPVVISQPSLQNIAGGEAANVDGASVASYPAELTHTDVGGRYLLSQ